MLSSRLETMSTEEQTMRVCAVRETLGWRHGSAAA
jgi:hypothetical protein